MMLRWIAAAAVSGALVTALPALAQSPAAKDATPVGAAPASPQAPNGPPGDPNVSYPLANGGTYQGPLTGQPDPTGTFYHGYNRT